MRIGVLGTGAVGGLYGGWLAAAGHEVWFLARSDMAVLREQGLSITSPRGATHIQSVNVVANAAEMPTCDWVLVSWKSTANKDLPKTLALFCNDSTRVICLQNGLQPETVLFGTIAESRIFAGLCFLCASRVAPGKIWHQDYGAITLAGISLAGAAGITSELEAGATLLRSAGIEVQCVADWQLARWRKLVWNIAFNGPCALTGLNTAELLSQANYRNWVLQLMQETVLGAKACGISISQDFPDKMLVATQKMAPYEPSMKLDADAGRPLEIDAIYSQVVDAIERAKGHAPGIAHLEAQLKARFTA
jgi:2-dehydropantoate 2-reductase